MNLKEAFRYQNYLDSLFMKADLYLSNSLHTIEVTQVHHRSKADPDATDEVLTSEKLYPNRGQHYPIDGVVKFMLSVMEEKRALSSEITSVKRYSAFQLDHELACNKVVQNVARRLGMLASLRPRNNMTTGTAHRFNMEGNQVSYAYEVEEQQSVAFDQKEVRRMSKELLARADETSNRAECFMLETVLNFTPCFDVNDSFDEAIETFLMATSVTE